MNGGMDISLRPRTQVAVIVQLAIVALCCVVTSLVAFFIVAIGAVFAGFRAELPLALLLLLAGPAAFAGLVVGVKRAQHGRAAVLAVAEVVTAAVAVLFLLRSTWSLNAELLGCGYVIAAVVVLYDVRDRVG
jgi:hypothetical protein